MVGRPGVCYFVEFTEMKWEAAVDFCRAEGWSLMDVEDATENDMLKERRQYFGP